MRIRAKRIEAFLLTLAISGGATFGQGNSAAPASSATPAPVAAAPGNPGTENNVQPASPGNPATPAPNSGGSSASNTSTALDYLYNRRPQEGSAGAQVVEANEAAKARAIAADAVGLGGISDPQLRARFEKYIGMSEVPSNQLQAYAQGMEKVKGLLRNNKTFEAWRALQDLAAFQTIDAGVSQELANRIESIWNTDKASNHIDSDNQKLREQIKQSENNADLMSEGIRKQEIVLHRQETQGRNGKNQPSKPANNGGVPSANGSDDGSNLPTMPSTQGLDGRLRLTEEYLRALEARARIKLNELKAQKLFEKAKTDFADYTQTLFKSGRHQHVILAADFYRRLFDEDAYPVEMANEVNASLEIARDVAGSVDVFRYKVGRNEMTAATSRLEEAFTTSELQPAVLGLERSLKEKIGDYLTRMEKMQNLIEARDFGTLETQIEETKRQVADFDATKALALVNCGQTGKQTAFGQSEACSPARRSQGGNG